MSILDEPFFYAVFIGGFLYFGIWVWAIVDANRRERLGWAIALYFLGPVALIAWLVYGRRKD